MSQNERLFADPKEPLASVLRKREKDVLQEIEASDRKKLTSRTADMWADEFANTAGLLVPQIDMDKMKISLGESESNGESVAVLLHIPFKGNLQLFRHRPSQAGPADLFGQVVGDKVVIPVVRNTHNVDEFKHAIGQACDNLRGWLKQVADEVSTFRQSFRATAKARVEERLRRMARDQQFLQALGFPLKE
jgi:hypothetical protein